MQLCQVVLHGEGSLCCPEYEVMMRLEKRPWLLAKTIQRNLEKKKKKKKAIYALNGIVFAGWTVGTSEWSTEGMMSDCGTLSGKSRVQVVA